MNRKKMLISGIVLILAGITAITGVAVVTAKYDSSSGGVVSETINRVNIEVSATQFTFSTPDRDNMLECRTTVSIEKTEPDFYGQLGSITVSGADFGYVMYTAGRNNGDAALPENVMLPSENPYEWEITFTVPYEEGVDEYNLSLDINYTTGVKPNLRQEYIKSIPIKINIG